MWFSVMSDQEPGSGVEVAGLIDHSAFIETDRRMFILVNSIILSMTIKESHGHSRSWEHPGIPIPGQVLLLLRLSGGIPVSNCVLCT